MVKQYSAEFKLEAAKMVVDHHYTVAKAAQAIATGQYNEESLFEGYRAILQCIIIWQEKRRLKSQTNHN